MEVWNICEEITSKKNWYVKVFDTEILNKWRVEMNNCHEFDVAINLLRSSAKGVKHLNNCPWEVIRTCPKCDELWKQYILENPTDYGLDTDHPNITDYPNWRDDNESECPHVKCQCVPPDSLLENYIEYHSEGLINYDLHNKCKEVVRKISLNEPIDWHPNSFEQVRDIIHPSMYCYVKGISKHDNGLVRVDEKDEEREKYQWLPSQFMINETHQVKVTSYINNLDHHKYPEFIPLIEEVFSQFLPSLEKIINISLKNSELQVIVKVGDIILTKSKPHYSGGSWHIEGMPYEHIIATCIHYVDINRITPSFLEFRKPTIINEDNIDYPQSDSAYTMHHYGITEHFNGAMNRYLGLISCHEGASVIFPNSLQHRVKEFSLLEDYESSSRTILCFFIIDPNNKIISTADIPPQQSIFMTGEANYYRERLMLHRKYYVDEMNEIIYEREFSLCEH